MRNIYNQEGALDMADSSIILSSAAEAEPLAGALPPALVPDAAPHAVREETAMQPARMSANSFDFFMVSS